MALNRSRPGAAPGMHRVCPSCRRQRWAGGYRRTRAGHLSCPDCGHTGDRSSFVEVRTTLIVADQATLAADRRRQRAA